MERFLTRHEDRIAGILTGFDRMRFRGTLRSISNAKGLAIWLNQRHVLLKEFGRYAEQLSAQVTAHAHTMAGELGRPFEYLGSWKIRKEDRAREILRRDGLREGSLRSSPVWKAVDRSACAAIAARNDWSWCRRSADARICISTTGTT